MYDYERSKLGAEWEVMERRNLLGNAVLTVIFTLQAMLPSNRLPYNLKNLQFMVVFSLVLLVFFNACHYFRVRRIDMSGAAALKDYADYDLTFGVVEGFLAGVIVLGTVVFSLLQ